jgi:hypothetical protein
MDVFVKDRAPRLLEKCSSRAAGHLALRKPVFAFAGMMLAYAVGLGGAARADLPTIAARVNLAKYQSVTTDSVSGQLYASYVTDGVAGNGSYWQSSGSAPHWVRVQFPFPVEIGSAHLYMGIDDGSAPTSFRLQYLAGSTWQDVPGGVISGNTSVERNIVFTTPVTASAFRIYDTVDGTIRIKEFALFPPAGPEGYPIGTDVTLNVAKKRLATANSNTSGHYAKLAVDGFVDNYSIWRTAHVGSNGLVIDLRVNTKIGSAHLYSGSSGVAPLANFVLNYRNPLGQWQAIPGASISGNTSSNLVISFASPVITSRVLLAFTNASMSSVRELCVFPANNPSGYPLGTDVVAAAPPAQKFDDYRDSFYNIIYRTANRAITSDNGVPRVRSSGLTGQQGQYQVLWNIGTDTYRLRNRVTGRCLAGPGLSTNAGDLLVEENYTALPNQNWRLQPINDTDFYIVNEWSGLMLDAQSVVDGAPLTQNTNVVFSTTQRWRLVLASLYPKKGTADFVDQWDQFKANWSYNWGRGNMDGMGLPAGVAFNPMQWGNFSPDVIPAFHAGWRREAKAAHLLGFNEPDGADQANMSVSDAIALWPLLEAADLPLVSPAPASQNGGWLASFYTQANSRGYRVDYTGIHTYPGPNSGYSDNIINSLETAYNTWGRPVWLTEFSAVDWSGGASWTEEDNYNWLAEFLWRAEGLSWLRKYSLFMSTDKSNWPAPSKPWSAVGPRSNTFDTNGNLTAFGELYAAWDGDAAVRSNKVYIVHNRLTRKRIANTRASSPNASWIRSSDTALQWALAPAGSPGIYHLVSQLDGRRLSYVDGGSVSLTPPGTTGGSVEWKLTGYQYGWYYLDHPATSKRLRLQYNNSTSVATYTMEANTSTGDSYRWRFIVPVNPADISSLSAPSNLVAAVETGQASLTWNAAGGTNYLYYSVYRTTTTGTGYSLIASNLVSPAYTDTNLTAGATYYYVATVTDWMGRESDYSNEAIAAPGSALPTTPTNIVFTISDGSLMLNWPSNYIGWLLQVQTNSIGEGLGTNWTTLPDSDLTNSVLIPVDLNSPAVFFRLVHP